jgi:hypothetical protein
MMGVLLYFLTGRSELRQKLLGAIFSRAWFIAPPTLQAIRHRKSNYDD